MTLGDKIKKYRIMRNLTQKDLGIKAGFPSATADSRIRKYEKDLMAPKADKRQEIADALEIDISSLSDIDIRNNADIMHILFEFEELLGMEIERKNNKTYLVFDDSNKDIQQLISYLYIWYNQKKSLPTNSNEESSYESLNDYNIWKSRFPMDLHQFWEQQEQKLETFYAPKIKELATTQAKIKTASELLLLLRKLIQTDLTIDVSTKYYTDNTNALALTFHISELLNEENSKINFVYTEFLYVLETLKEYGMVIDTNLLTTEKGTQISYYLVLSPLSVYSNIITELQQFESQKETLDDWSKELFEHKFEEHLKTYDMDLKKEIEFYSNN